MWVGRGASMTSITETAPQVPPAALLGPRRPHPATAIVGVPWRSALMYIVWGLMSAGEPLFAAVTATLLRRYRHRLRLATASTPRASSSRLTAVLIFIALPVLYTSYVGFTNFGARNLPDLRSRRRHITSVSAPSTSPPSALRPSRPVAPGPMAATSSSCLKVHGGRMSPPFTLDGTPITLDLRAGHHQASR